VSDDHMTDFDRFGRITASVVSAILRSEGETRSAKWAWRVITGREPIKPPGPDCERGLEHEDDAIAAAEAQLCALARPGRFVSHRDFDWLGASPDGFIEEGGLAIPIEAKCPRQLHAEIPPKYCDQVQTQIECCNVPHAYFVSWTESGGKWVTKVERDPAWWSRSKPILEAFYNDYVLKDVEPPRAQRRKKEK